MKVALTFLALVALSYSAPQPRKLFHEHFEDFLDVIFNEVGDTMEKIAGQYVEFEEFMATVRYLGAIDFQDLISEMETIPEFKAVVDFLENHDLDIQFFINNLKDNFEEFKKRSLRQEVSGRDLSSFIRDNIDVFPKAKLAALYEKKMAEDEKFRHAMESFETEEWNEIYSALWENETFLNEVATLKENGFDVELILFEYKATLGLN